MTVSMAVGMAVWLSLIAVGLAALAVLRSGAPTLILKQERIQRPDGSCFERRTVYRMPDILTVSGKSQKGGAPATRVIDVTRAGQSNATPSRSRSWGHH